MNSDATDVYFCYSRKDSHFVRPLTFALGQTGLSVNFDSEGLQDDRWEDRLDYAILRSHIFIFVITENSLGSIYDHKELNFARSLHKPVLAIQLESLDFAALLPSLKTSLAQNMHKRYVDDMSLEDIDDNIRFLLSLNIRIFDRIHYEEISHELEPIINDMIQQNALATKILIRANRWDKVQRNPDFLLKGSDLYEALMWLNNASPATSLQIAYINASQRASKKSPARLLLNRMGLYGNDRIFISYRRDDSQDICRSIYDELVKKFGKRAIFFDIDTIPYGADFAEYIADTLNKCSVFLAVIGKTWLSIADNDGKVRLDNPNDWVRLEVKTALHNSNITVIPVLIDDTRMPSRTKLPEDICELAYRNAMSINSDHRFSKSMEELITVVEQARKI